MITSDSTEEVNDNHSIYTRNSKELMQILEPFLKEFNQIEGELDGQINLIHQRRSTSMFLTNQKSS
jgi:hypothetical protein